MSSVSSILTESEKPIQAPKVPKVPKQSKQFHPPPQKSYSTFEPKVLAVNQKTKVFYCVVAVVIVFVIILAFLIAGLVYYGNQLRKCKGELEKQKRENAHAQQMLENRIRQMDQAADLPLETVDEMQETEGNPSQSPGWRAEGTDPSGTRTKRDGAMMGDMMMDRELRNKVRFQPGTMR